MATPEKTNSGRVPRLLIEVEPWHRQFLRNLRELLAGKAFEAPVYRRSSTGPALYSPPRLANEIPPWHRVFFEDLRSLFQPGKLPPVKLTSKPVAVADIWENKFYAERLKRSQAISITAHALVLLLVSIPFIHHTAQATKPTLILTPIEISPYALALPPSTKQAGGGGGGGERNPLPATKGRLPRFAMEQFTPPVAVIRNPQPKLPMEPTVVVPPDIKVPQPNLAQYGDPLSNVMAPLSGGPGSGGGIGTGSGGGVGSGSGPGVGPGYGGGIGGGVFRVGGNVSAPVLIYKVEPQYSEEARKAKYQGTVVIWMIVDVDGLPHNIRVVKSVGLGLDERAVEAVRQWRFKPAMRLGQPVPVYTTVEVTFRLF